MSNEVNVVETFYGTISPGVTLEFYDWSGKYDDIRKKARFFTVAPDPWISLGEGVLFESVSNRSDLELTRTWASVWVDENGNATFQRNAAVANVGQITCSYHLLRAETDN